jgi:hypothetical protein
MSPTDPRPAYRGGRARLRRRLARVPGTPALAAAIAVVAALTVGAAPITSAAQAATGPTAPGTFGPTDPFLSFGWLPAGLKLVDGDILPQVVAIDGARKMFAGRDDWEVSAYAAGQCHLTAQDKGLKCTSAAYGLNAKFDGRAPDVAGHRAHWSGYWLIWQYAPGGWAFLTAPFPAVPYKGPKRTPKLVRQAVKIATNVHYGAATPTLKFPLQLTGLPSQWQVSSVFYQPAAGVFEATRLALTTGKPDLGADGGLEYQSGIPYFGIQNATPHGSCYRYKKRKNFSDKSKVLTIHGHRVVVTNFPRPRFPGQGLCTAHAVGLSFYINQQGKKHPPMGLVSLFRDHLRILGADPAKWTAQPIK